MDIIDNLRDKIKENKITEPIEVKEALKNIIEEILTNENSTLNVEKISNYNTYGRSEWCR